MLYFSKAQESRHSLKYNLGFQMNTAITKDWLENIAVQ
jgi:hypothetical protein